MLRDKKDEWFRSLQGHTALDPDILHFDSYQNILKDRLDAAFEAGAKAEREIAVDKLESFQYNVFIS